MKIALLNILGFLAFTILVSCTKVIEVDLNEANQRIVVDGFVENTDSLNTFAFVKITKTGSYYSNNEFDTISNVSLFIKDNSGIIYPMIYDGSGIFSTNQLPVGSSFDYYELYGNIEGEEISAVSTMPNRVEIDSVGAYKIPFGPHANEGYTPVCFFTDLSNEKNYYRLKIIVNKSHYSDIYINRDDGQDGEQIAFPFFNIMVNQQDTITVELLSIDEFSFDYYKVLSQNSGGGGFSAAPGNPNTNIEGNAIGIFTAQTSSRETIIVE